LTVAARHHSFPATTLRRGIRGTQPLRPDRPRQRGHPELPRNHPQPARAAPGRRSRPPQGAAAESELAHGPLQPRRRVRDAEPALHRARAFPLSEGAARRTTRQPRLRAAPQPRRGGTVLSRVLPLTAVLRQRADEIVVQTRGRDLVEITRALADFVHDSGIQTGLLTVHLRHTSASLLIQENE